MAMIKTDSKHYTDIANKIRESLNVEDEFKPSEMADKIGEVSALKDNAPYLNTSEITDFGYWCREGARTETLPKLDTSNAIRFYHFCYNNKNVEVIPSNLDFSKASALQQCFYGCTSLHTIEYMDLSSVPYATGSSGITNAFGNCSALVEIRIKEECLRAPISLADSPLLSDESVNSVIGCLRQLTTNKLKVTFHLDVYNKLTEEQLTTIANKGWEVVSA